MLASAKVLKTRCLILTEKKFNESYLYIFSAIIHEMTGTAIGLKHHGQIDCHEFWSFSCFPMSSIVQFLLSLTTSKRFFLIIEKNFKMSKRMEFFFAL
jgi:hypothetical protein